MPSSKQPKASLPPPPFAPPLRLHKLTNFPWSQPDPSFHVNWIKDFVLIISKPRLFQSISTVMLCNCAKVSQSNQAGFELDEGKDENSSVDAFGKTLRNGSVVGDALALVEEADVTRSTTTSTSDAIWTA